MQRWQSWASVFFAIPLLFGCGKGANQDRPLYLDAGVDVFPEPDLAIRKTDLAVDGQSNPSGDAASTSDGQALGRPCSLLVDAGASQAAYNPSAAACFGQACLKPLVQSGAAMPNPPTESYCSASCEQDSDCDGEVRDPANPTDKRCQKGFACAIPFVVGSLCCQKLCVCKDFLGPAGATIPTACDAAHDNGANCSAATSSGGVEQETDIYIALKTTRQVDLVTMVDNSSSMAPKVGKFNTQFPKLIDSLKDPNDGSLPDLRVAIIDSDLGTGGAYASGACATKILSDGSSSSYGDLGRFQMLNSPSACTFNSGAQYLEYKGGVAANYTGDIGSVFTCLTSNLGTFGCGEEHQLQAFEFALVAGGIGNDSQHAMLRSNAYLGLIFLSDEDDCSAALNDGMFGDKPELRGESASLRCATRAHACGGQNLTVSPPGYPTGGAFSHSFFDCAARTDSCPNVIDGAASGTDTSVATSCSPLKNIKHLAEEIKGLKSDPNNQILVAGIFGWPLSDADMANAQYKIAPVPNPNTADAQHPTVYDYWPICYDPNHPPSDRTTDVATSFDSTAAGWGATGGLRESSFVDEFGANGLKFSVCQPDFANSMKSIGNAIANKLQYQCFDYKLVDTDAATAGVQADCRVVYRAPVTDPTGKITYQESATLPQCPAGASNGNVATSCWQLASEPTRCPKSGQWVNVLRSAGDISAKPQFDQGTKLEMQCRTCPDAIPGSAAIPGCGY